MLNEEKDVAMVEGEQPVQPKQVEAVNANGADVPAAAEEAKVRTGRRGANDGPIETPEELVGQFEY